uniref:Wnt inhibitory factor protein n=1 Tax=Terebratalia transversa TaxID=34513 RepID=A0AAU7E8Z9_TERTR
MRGLVPTLLFLVGLLMKDSFGRQYRNRYRSRTRISLLSMWIDETQMAEFLGRPMKIPIVNNGIVLPYFKNKGFFQSLPVIPPEIDVVRLRWVARIDQYSYWFQNLKSEDDEILYKPLLSIPLTGRIPPKETEFQIAIPCTGKKSGIVAFEIDVYIFRQNIPISGSPIKLRLSKRCKALNPGKTQRSICNLDCQNGGICSQQKTCICMQGYSGKLCEKATCSPVCLNNGSCIAPNQCKCQHGYAGSNCERAKCSRPCYNGGRCIGPDQCLCSKGFHGLNCQLSSCGYPCSNGGRCMGQNNCVCPTGYGGQLCEIPKCYRSCGLHGMCVDVGVCRCELGWHGRYCNKKSKHNRHHRKRRKDRKKRNRKHLSR